MHILLVVLQGFSPLQDSVALRATADSFLIPYSVVEAIAWMETRNGLKWNSLGPGVIDSTWLSDGRLQIRRVCRELGRFQLRGCFNWSKILGDTVCVQERLRTDYASGVHCGIRNLRRMYLMYGSWVEVIKRQNGSGPLADKYLREALAYIGWRHLYDK